MAGAIGRIGELVYTLRIWGRRVLGGTVPSERHLLGTPNAHATT